MTGRTHACEVPGRVPGASGPPESYRSAVAHKNQFDAVLDAARVLLADEPSSYAMRAAAGRIGRAVLALADQLAEEQGADR